ncbi:hypothetical protein JHN63_07570 [Streptomyces sp. MBT65]|uniref:hypothetical protein n=1 Tax=Streptomyces sp. MBT65 TaxID=1488395 RepID=UPI00190A485F|nr:hypothetical protein [Streptomyces sp. MBT65]MBK3573676.1 hypothetical protein [Streptomyces sp. MBT65]
MADGNGVPEKVAWVLVRDDRVLVTRSHGRDLFHLPGGHRGGLTPSREIAEKAWLCYSDRDRVSAVDEMAFDALHEAGRIS